MTALGFSTAACALQAANNIVSPLRRVRVFLEDPMVIGFWGGGLIISEGARSWPAKPRTRLSAQTQRRGYRRGHERWAGRFAQEDSHSAEAGECESSGPRGDRGPNRRLSRTGDRHFGLFPAQLEVIDEIAFRSFAAARAGYHRGGVSAHGARKKLVCPSLIHPRPTSVRVSQTPGARGTYIFMLLIF
jgi:hypothetical protein